MKYVADFGFKTATAGERQKEEQKNAYPNSMRCPRGFREKGENETTFDDPK